MKLTFKEEQIQALFGHEAAEDELPSRLRQYYIKSSTYDQVVTSLPLRILVGHKGIGKSALFQIAMAEDRDAGRLTLVVQPDDVIEIGQETGDFLRPLETGSLVLLICLQQRPWMDWGRLARAGKNGSGRIAVALWSSCWQPFNRLRITLAWIQQRN